MKPGTYTRKELSNHDYHASEGISSTTLKLMLKSPAHLFRQEKKDPSAAMIFGSQVHARILEPETFDAEYMVLRNAKDRRSSEYKQAVETHGVERVIMPDDASRLDMIVESVSQHPTLSHWLYEADGHNELSMYATDPETGLLVKCRFDRLMESGFDLDIKTTSCAAPFEFGKQIGDLGYYFSAAFYAMVYSWATGEKLRGRRYGAIETVSPFNVEAYRQADEGMRQGMKEVRRCLNKYAECLESGVWHGYSAGEEQFIDIAPWRIEEDEE